MKAFITDIAGNVYVAHTANCQITEATVRVHAPAMYVRSEAGNGHRSNGVLTGSITMDQYQIEDIRYVS